MKKQNHSISKEDVGKVLEQEIIAAARIVGNNISTIWEVDNLSKKDLHDAIVLNRMTLSDNEKVRALEILAIKYLQELLEKADNNNEPIYF
jgi:hypothetical protein